MGKLTARQCATTGPGKHEDGGGLRLVVSKTGSKKWVLRVTVGGKRREMGLGAYGAKAPGVSLAQAREKAAQARTRALEGVDPIKVRHQVEPTIPSFISCAAQYLRAHRRGWSNPKHARQWVRTLKTYARPVIGNKTVDAIGTDDVLKILQPIWTTRTETAKRTQSRVENILDYASAMKWRDPINPARWRGHLDKLLASPTKLKKQRNGGATRHQPAMDYHVVPSFMVELRENTCLSSSALQILVLTATRTSEVLQAQWSEVDLEAAVWTIPPQRMKARREHRVPLTKAAVTILEALPRIDGNPYLFPGARHGRPLSNMSLLMLMRGMGYGVNGDRGDAVPHGFRSSFRDWSGEVSSFPTNLAEAALAHVIGDKTEAAYARGDLFVKRRAMMEAWSGWCLSPMATVAHIKHASA